HSTASSKVATIVHPVGALRSHGILGAEILLAHVLPVVRKVVGKNRAGLPWVDHLLQGEGFRCREWIAITQKRRLQLMSLRRWVRCFSNLTTIGGIHASFNRH